MFPVGLQDPYQISMTSGFVKDMAAAVADAQTTIDISVERESLGETWLYGRFSPAGFSESLAKRRDVRLRPGQFAGILIERRPRTRHGRLFPQVPGPCSNPPNRTPSHRAAAILSFFSGA